MHAGMQRNKGHVVPSMGTCSYMQHLKVKILTGSTCWKLSYEGRRPFWRSPGLEAVQRYLSCGNGASTALFLIYCPIFSLYFLHPSQLLNVFNYFVTLSETFIAWVQSSWFYYSRKYLYSVFYSFRKATLHENASSAGILSTILEMLWRLLLSLIIAGFTK